ncbi:hypothetical protein JYG23_04265 [Sedimentibacter sp. zth1]|uniref:hypothetical protein n=1 Tax=Sedimentibacter sp. zth1 TaxID=2816908 RepID=UPI001A9122E3|nr:hypothetical protein [Sedimentibacter sp. zth1]QSX06676.1 hypothetical protein JYG23_04265 [Sedimentibacter sp. zth1]
MKIKILLLLIISILLISCISTNENEKEISQNEYEVIEYESEHIKDVITQEEVDINDEIETEENLQVKGTILQDEQLLLNGISLTEKIIYSVYRGKENYSYEVLLYAFAKDDSKDNLYRDYFSYDKQRNAFIFPIDKANEVLIQVFGEKEYSFNNLFDYDEETDTYYKCLDFGWDTGNRAKNITASISDDKLELYTNFEFIDIWYGYEEYPEPPTIADCKITYSIVKNNEKFYLRFKDMVFSWREEFIND